MVSLRYETLSLHFIKVTFENKQTFYPLKK